VNLLFCGDVMGRAGRLAIETHLPRLKRELMLDFVIANGENAAGGYGITGALCQELFDAGVDVITSGNHIWDQREIVTVFAREPRLLRPQNYPAATPGTGVNRYQTQRGQTVAVINVMGRLFMDPLDDPFACVEAALAAHALGAGADAIVIDVHGEAASEKQAIAHMVDGRASLVVGSHTHSPTADSMILDGGTAFQTDAGMCGDYNSVIGGDRQLWVEKFRSKMPVGRINSSDGEGTLCAVFIETVEHSGLARRIAPVVVGGRLAQRWPG